MPTAAELHAFLVAVISNLVALAAGVVGVAFTVYGVLKRETPRGKVALVFALAAYTLALGAAWVEEHRLRMIADNSVHALAQEKARLLTQVDEKNTRIDGLERLLSATLVKGQAKPEIKWYTQVVSHTNADVKSATVVLILPDKPLPTPTDVVVLCSDEIVDSRWSIYGASSMLGGGPVPALGTSGPLQGWRGSKYQVNSPNITPDHPLIVTMYSRKPVECRPVQVGGR